MNLIPQRVKNLLSEHFPLLYHSGVNAPSREQLDAGIHGALRTESCARI
jgi:hypothetical protein